MKKTVKIPAGVEVIKTADELTKVKGGPKVKTNSAAKKRWGAHWAWDHRDQIAELL